MGNVESQVWYKQTYNDCRILFVNSELRRNLLNFIRVNGEHAKLTDEDEIDYTCITMELPIFIHLEINKLV